MAKRAATGGSATPSSRYKADPAHRIVVLAGKDLHLRTERTREIRAALEAEHGGVDEFRHDGDSARIADVLDECRSFGLMSAHKLVIVDHADALVRAASDDDAGPSNARRLLERYAEAPPDSATLVLRAETWRGGNLDKAVAKVGAVVSCAPPAEGDLPAEASRLARDRHGIELEPQAAALLADAIGPDLARLDSEIAKLAVAASAHGLDAITRDLALELCGGVREISPWSVQGPLLTGDAAQAVAGLRRVLAGSPRGAHVPAAYAAVQAAAMLHARAAANAALANNADVAKAYRSWGDAARALDAAAKRLDPPAARRLLDAALRTDAKGKTGVGEPVRNLELLALRFAAALGGSPPTRGGAQRRSGPAR